MAINQQKPVNYHNSLDYLQKELQRAEKELENARKALKEEGIAALPPVSNKRKKVKDSITVAVIGLGCFVAMLLSDYFYIIVVVVYIFLAAYEIYITLSLRNDRVAKKVSACNRREKQVNRLKRKVEALRKEKGNGRSKRKL